MTIGGKATKNKEAMVGITQVNNTRPYLSLLFTKANKWKRSYKWIQAPKWGKIASLICECELMVKWPSNSQTRPNFGQPKPTKEKSQSNTGIQWLNNQTDSLTHILHSQIPVHQGIQNPRVQ